MADDDVTQDVTGDVVHVDVPNDGTGVDNPVRIRVPDGGLTVESTRYVPLEQPRTEHRPPPSEPVHYQPYE